MNSNKLGAILLQLPPSFTVDEFKNIEGFLQKLPLGYHYAVEFRHPSWKAEGPWDLDLFSKRKTSSYIFVFKQNLIHESLYYLYPIL
jgi:uncharacterized protein YecE (DUF72 family)